MKIVKSNIFDYTPVCNLMNRKNNGTHRVFKHIIHLSFHLGEICVFLENRILTLSILQDKS